LKVIYPERTLLALVIRHLITYYLIKEVFTLTRTVQPQTNLVIFEYININTKSGLADQKKQKEIFNSRRRNAF
jgi:hypothetical protein